MKRIYIIPRTKVQPMCSADCICIVVGSVNSDKVSYGGGVEGGTTNDPW